MCSLCLRRTKNKSQKKYITTRFNFYPNYEYDRRTFVKSSDDDGDSDDGGGGGSDGYDDGDGDGDGDGNGNGDGNGGGASGNCKKDLRDGRTLLNAFLSPPT
uniref:Uncharacterized protein n=1 Tax=Vespula pensylvanica TaxID=30213 RepID=A0A834P001_VESPE|nr:hypothetical protein H0235_008516 [Vespula pensylvanica]